MTTVVISYLIFKEEMKVKEDKEKYTYNDYGSDLKHGEKMTISRRMYLEGKTLLSVYTDLSENELKNMLNDCKEKKQNV